MKRLWALFIALAFAGMASCGSSQSIAKRTYSACPLPVQIERDFRALKAGDEVVIEQTQAPDEFDPLVCYVTLGVAKTSDLKKLHHGPRGQPPPTTLTLYYELVDKRWLLQTKLSSRKEPGPMSFVEKLSILRDKICACKDEACKVSISNLALRLVGSNDGALENPKTLEVFVELMSCHNSEK